MYKLSLEVCLKKIGMAKRGEWSKGENFEKRKEFCYINLLIDLTLFLWSVVNFHLKGA